MNKIINIKNNIQKSISNIKKTPPGMAAGINDTYTIEGIEIPLIELFTKSVYSKELLNTIIDKWSKYFNNGRWNNKIFTYSDIIFHDSSYKLLSFNEASYILESAVKITRKILGAYYSSSIFDCDDFATIIQGIFSLILLKSGIENSGAGIGKIAIDYYKGNKLYGHALNFLPINNLGMIDLYLAESQNGNIYKIDENNYKELKIHELSM